MGRKANKPVVIEITVDNKDNIVKQYIPLVHKITRQMNLKNGVEYGELLSIGFDGLLYAIDRYKQNTSQSFTQYAAYMIRFHILNYINSGATKLIRMSSTAVKTNENNGFSNMVVVSIDDQPESSEHRTSTLDKIVGESDSSIYNSLGDDVDTMWGKIFTVLNEVFSARDITIFYRRFGINGYKICKGIELAKEYNTSSVNITTTCNKIIKYMKNDKRMSDILLDILQQTNI